MSECCENERDLIAEYIEERVSAIGRVLGRRHEELMVNELERIAEAIRRDEHR